jgi:hypothetical protein
MFTLSFTLPFWIGNVPLVYIAVTVCGHFLGDSSFIGCLPVFLMEYFVSYLVVMTYSGGIFSSIVTAHSLLALLLSFPQSAIIVMDSAMSLPNTNCTGVAFSVVWNELHIAYAAEDKNGPQGSFSSIYLPSI